jgi:predicted permease
MLRNYFKVALRNLFKNKVFSLINIAGLTIGMTCTILIMLWVYNERSWDKSQKNYNTVYHVYGNRNFNGEVNSGPDMMYPLPQAAKAAFPEVEKAALVSFGETTLFSVGEKKVNRPTLTVSADFFDIFSYHFLAGNASAVTDPDAVILTESMTKTLFGNTDNALGKPVEINNGRMAYVKAIIEDPSKASTLQFDGIIPINPSSPDTRNRENEWVNCGDRVMLKVKEGTNIAQLEQKILQLIKAKSPSENPTTRGSIILHPMTKWRLYEQFRDGKNVGGRIQYVNLFTWIALIILVIACVNFMNLSTARSEKRAREVGIRKTLGSERKQLLTQFITESVLISLIAFFLAIVMVLLVLPVFNNILQQEIVVPYQHINTWLLAFGIILVTGFVAGSYPALYLSALQPVKVLKGNFLPGKKALMPRKVLVTAQFIVSIVLISATIIIYQQLEYVRSRNLGYDTHNLLMVSASRDVNKNYTALKNDLLQSGMVTAVNRTSSPVSNIFGFTSGVRWAGAPNDPNLVIGFLFADEGFANAMSAKMIDGRDFRMNDTNTVILNKEVVRIMGLKNPVGTNINWAGRERTVVGVIDNLIMSSPYAPPSPLMIVYENKWSNSVNIRMKAGADIQQTLASLEKLFKQYNPDYPFDYRFADTEFDKKFANEQLIGKLGFAFAGLAIFVCCLGLFGLVSFSIERRTKEIGIRKILGASMQQLLILMSREFLVLVAIAFLIAIPLAWWAMNDWLNNFDYRIRIGLWVFFLVGMVTLIICLVTVSLNALKTAKANPVKSLRTE